MLTKYSMQIDFKPSKRKSITVLAVFLVMVLLGFNLKHAKLVHNDEVISSGLSLPNQKFLINRAQILQQVEGLFKQQTSKIQSMLLAGPGGAGKTTIARLYGRTQQFALVWEFNAERSDSLMDSFNDLAFALATTIEQQKELALIQTIQDSARKAKAIINFVKSLLKELPNWLLIYDNVENCMEIKDYLPQDANSWGTGKVLVTTRDLNLTKTSYLKDANVLVLGALKSRETLELFCKILHNTQPEKLAKDEQEKLGNFLDNLPAFPLDIATAAYYIKNTGITYQEYLQAIKDVTNDFEMAQETILKEANDYSKSRYGILTLSFKKLIKINPNFKELLFLICLLDSQNIPIALLEKYKDQSVVEQFLYQLKRHSLITCEQQFYASSNAFSIHRMTQQVAKNFLLKNPEANTLSQVKDIIAIISGYCAQYIEANSKIGLAFIPHLQELLKNLHELNTDDLLSQSVGEVLYALGNTHLRCSHNLILAKVYLTEFYKISLILEKKLDKAANKEKLAFSLKNLGIICRDLELADEAILYAQEGLKLTNCIANSDIIKAQNFSTIGCAYTYKNNFSQAKLHFERALKQLELLTGKAKNEIESLIYSSLGHAYSVTFIAQEEANQAVTYLHHALKLVEGDKTFCNGPTNIKISRYIAAHKVTLGDIYCHLGQYDKAMNEGFNEANFIVEHALDNTPHDGLLKVYILIGISEVLLRKGQLQGAKETIHQTLEEIQKIAGEDSSLALSPKIFGIETDIRLGALEEAYKECEKLFNFKIKSKTNHALFLYLTNFFYAAVIKYKDHDYTKALQHFQEFFNLMENFCKNFFSKRTYLALKGKKLFEVQRGDNGNEKSQLDICLQHSLEIYKQIYGEEHPFVKNFLVPLDLFNSSKVAI